MIMKVFAATFLLFHFGLCGLLKTPKVYNALITTDENITPSKSYPVIQPHIHESGFAYPAYSLGGYGPFGAAAVYDPTYPFAAPNFINPGFLHRHHGLQHIGSRNNQNTHIAESEMHGIQGAQNENHDAERNATASQEEQHGQSESNINQQHSNNLPIPLNEFGLPPNLIPINPYNYNFNPNPINLAPYPYNSYPLVYDQYSGYNQNPYLPPFGYYPQTFAEPDTTAANKRVKGLPKKSKMQTNFQAPESSGNNDGSDGGSQDAQQLDNSSSIDIKNFANKNKDIPDVPPPPLPSGAKITSN